jgi:hypothetical protein
MVRVNITVASLLGGFGTRFWIWLFMGVALTYTLESILTFLGLTGLVEITKPNSIPQPSGYSLAGLGVTSGSLALLAVSWDLVENAPQS